VSKSTNGESDDAFYSDDPQILPTSKFSKINKVFALVAMLAGSALFLNTTLAANISLNNGQSVEFGQGFTQAVACSGGTNLTITPNSTFTNTSGSGAYYLSSVTVSNIPTSCYGRDFTLNAYDNASNTPLAIFNTTSTNAVIYNNAGTFQLGAGSTGMTISSRSGEFTVSFTAPVALSKDVAKVTIQSSAPGTVSCALGGVCIVGDTGPGGGKVFYVLAGGFSCGITRSATCNYLEIAPKNWNGGTDPQRPWAQSTPIDYTSANITLSAIIGYGALNTKAIIDQGNSNSATSAAALAASYSPVVNGSTVNDWFLPSENELAQVWTQRTVIGFSASGANYWSSTSTGNQNGRYFMFEGGTGPGQASGLVKSTATVYVRPVRAF